MQIEEKRGRRGGGGRRPASRPDLPIEKKKNTIKATSCEAIAKKKK